MYENYKFKGNIVYCKKEYILYIYIGMKKKLCRYSKNPHTKNMCIKNTQAEIW